MTFIRSCFTVIAVTATGLIGPLFAQAPRPSTRALKPDTPAVTRHIEAARKAAGTDWSEAVDFMCVAEPNSSRNYPWPDAPLMEGKVFDNAYVLGRTNTVVWAITTSAGIVLFDMMHPGHLESVVLPGLRKVGLDPANVRYVVVLHGHDDHFGDAIYFQQRGARVVATAGDWELMATFAAPGRAGGGRDLRAQLVPPRPDVPRSPANPPKRDMVLSDGEQLTVGDTTFTAVVIPGHTPGGLGLIFPVKDGLNTYTAGLYGNSVLVPGWVRDERQWQQYIDSIAHWVEWTRKLNVDVEVQNHPLYDRTWEKLTQLKARRPGQPHPFRIGQESYQRFLTVMSECSKAQMERRKL